MNELAPAIRKRVRLRPEVRSQQILDAALIEFSRHGFAATRIEDIAQGAGLSKSGVYAHFASKDDIFEALLMKVLPTTDTVDKTWFPDRDLPLEALIDAYLDGIYGRIGDPELIAVVRLVIAESERVPHIVRRWRVEMMDRHWAREQAMVDEWVERGLMRKSALTEQFSLAFAPALFWMIRYMVFKDEAEPPVEHVRQLHRRLLVDQLQMP